MYVDIFIDTYILLPQIEVLITNKQSHYKENNYPMLIE